MPVRFEIRLTRSGNLSLSKRIARGTKPFSLYASSPVGDCRQKIQIIMSTPAGEKNSTNRKPVNNLQGIRNFWKEHNTVNANITGLCHLRRKQADTSRRCHDEIYQRRKTLRYYILQKASSATYASIVTANSSQGELQVLRCHSQKMQLLYCGSSIFHKIIQFNERDSISPD